MVEFLLASGIDINRRFPENALMHEWGSPLAAATEYCWGVQMMKFLISKGADITARSESGWSVLHHAAAFGQFSPRFSELIDFILAEGTPIYVRNNAGLTPSPLRRRRKGPAGGRRAAPWQREPTSTPAPRTARRH